jgi:hypothetical protein
VPVDIQRAYWAGATGYTVDIASELEIYVPSASNTVFSEGLVAGPLTGTTNDFLGYPLVPRNNAVYANEPLMARISVANPTLGDGTLTIWVTYKVLTR